MPKKKLVKSFRKLIFPQAKGQTTALGKACLDNKKHPLPNEICLPNLSPMLQGGQP
jgi:hypothetical protein